MAGEPLRNRRKEAWDVEVGRRIRARRLECGLSQHELGEGLGVSFQQIQKYEKGVNRVSAGRLQRVGDVLKVPMTFFYDADASARTTQNRFKSTKLFGLLDNRDAQQLVTAFNAIVDRKLRRTVVRMIERIRDIEPSGPLVKRSRAQ